MIRTLRDLLNEPDQALPAWTRPGYAIWTSPEVLAERGETLLGMNDPPAMT